MGKKIEILDMHAFIQDYKSEMPMKELCAKYHISKQTVYNILKSEGVALNRHKLHDFIGCPLFKNLLYNNIYCEDCGDWSFLSLHFATRQKCREYRKKYCNGDYENCMVYKTMMEEFL